MFSLEDIQQIVKISEKSTILKDPGFIVGPISFVLGFVVNFVFNIIYGINPVNSLGFTIILFTIFIRILMLPLVSKQMKSMKKMQDLVPLQNEIKAKYSGAGKTDQESKQKETLEIQELYRKNGVNPLGGCLPMFIQMPIFFALNEIIRNSYRYVDKIGDLYSEISYKLMEMPEYITTLTPIIQPRLQNKVSIDIATVDGLNKAVNSLSANDWYEILASAPTEIATSLYDLLIQKNAIDTFMGMNLSENPTLLSISVIIPILSVITTFLTSWLSMKNNPSASGNDTAAQQQKMMMYMMPVLMGFMSFSLSAGVGLYWITSSIFQVIQQLFINKERSAVSK